MSGLKDLRYFGGVSVAAGAPFTFVGRDRWDFIQILKTSANLQVQLDNGRTYPLWNRSTLALPFSQLVLLPAVAPDIQIAPPGAVVCDFYVGKGEPENLHSIENIVQTCDSPPFVTCGTTAVTQLCGSSKNVWRRQFWNSTGGANVRIGDANVNNLSGLALPVGVGITLYGGGAVYAFNSSNTTAATMSFTEETY